MRITISFNTGAQSDGVVLSVDGYSMRVALRNAEDVSELRYESGRWYIEDNGPVQVDSLLVSAPGEWRLFESRLTAMSVN